MVLFRFELCRLICFTNKIVITHFFALDFRLRRLNVSLLLPSHNLHQMSQCSVFKVHHVSASFISFTAEQARRLNHSAALPFAPCPVASLPGSCRVFWNFFFKSFLELSLIETFKYLKASINKLFRKMVGQSELDFYGDYTSLRFV